MTAGTPQPGLRSTRLSKIPLFSHGRGSLTPLEVADAIGVSAQQVRDLFDSGTFLAIQIGDGECAKRAHLRIVRSSVEAWWLEKFLETNGFEYPCEPTPEITWWRAELRKNQPLGRGISQKGGMVGS